MQENFLECYPDKIKAVYNALQDDISRNIFRCRYLYQVSGDAEHLVKMFNSGNRTGRNTLMDIIAALSIVDTKIVMYGSGKRAVGLHSIFVGMNMEISHFCDSDPAKVGTEYLGHPVISPEELVCAHKNKYVFISSAYYTDEIYANLIRIGFPKERIFVQGNYNEQYFGEEFLRPMEDEIYVDAGCYTGDTIKRFIKFCGNDYKRIYGLEPSNANFDALINAFSLEKRIVLKKMGAWSCEATLSFNENTSCSAVSSDGADMIEMTSIDSLVGDDAVTLIKMDVEGSELEALKGAENTIIKNKPRLAISIYHRPEDILTIPLYIHELVPEYVFYIRHHAPYPDFSETVLYAVIK